MSGLFTTLLVLTMFLQTPQAQEATSRWWKGNLHTHTLWSDGNEYPEVVIDWYKDHGYQFLALSDHNVLAEGERWIDVDDKRGGGTVLERYRERFAADWVEEREADGKHQVRLKPFGEFRPLFEEPGRFLLLSAEEISDGVDNKPIHVNAIGLRDLIKPQGGATVLEALQRNVNAVLEQRRQTGIAMFPHLNHPNFGWAITAEELAQVEGEKFFEVYNGHPAVNNAGDAERPDTERIWDHVLIRRLAELNLPVMYGIATDDAHDYQGYGAGHANPGNGWVMVRARQLTPESIIRAMEAGDFYASTGVELEDVTRDGARLSLRIKPEEGVTYTTRFIGALRDEPKTSGTLRVAKLFKEVNGTEAVYEYKGDELYVRATVLSSKAKQNAPSPEETIQKAWIQPVIPGEGKDQT